MKTSNLIPFLGGLFLAPLLATAQQVPGPLIAHWSFDEETTGGSLLVRDSGPNNLDGHVKAPADVVPSLRRVPGIKGQALDLPADPTCWIELGTPPALDLKPPFTIAAWIKPAAPADMEILNRKWDSAPGGWRFRFLRSSIALDIGDETEEVRVRTDSGVPEAGRWAHVAATYDGKHIRLFVNGLETASEPARLAPKAVFQQKPIPAFLGCYVGNKQVYPFVGLLDEVMIFGRALSADELVSLAAGQQK